MGVWAQARSPAACLLGRGRAPDNQAGAWSRDLKRAFRRAEHGSRVGGKGGHVGSVQPVAAIGEHVAEQPGGKEIDVAAVRPAKSTWSHDR